jgi:hypothetical protein
VKQLVCGYYEELYVMSLSYLKRLEVVTLVEEPTLRPAITSRSIGRFQAIRMAINMTQAAIMVFVSSYQH